MGRRRSFWAKAFEYVLLVPHFYKKENMQFLSGRQVNFSINVSGQRMVVMFSDITGANVCSFITEKKDVIEAIRRHSYYKKGIVWEKPHAKGNSAAMVNPAEKSAGSAQSEAGNAQTEGVVTEAQLLVNKDGNGIQKAAGLGAELGTEAKGEGVFAFGNFTEAKEWFCKTYNVAKPSVKNPNALMAKAEEIGISIKIG